MIRTAPFVAMIGLAFLVAGCGAQIDESLTNLEVGDCVLDSAFGEVESVDTVECDADGAIKVIDVFAIEGYTEAYPGDTAIEDAASDGCPSSTITYLSPTKDSWEQADDREIVCFE
jgi:hypothetical protein